MKWIKWTLLCLLAAIMLPALYTEAQYDWGVQPERLGDVNADGAVNAADAAVVLRHSVGKQILSEVYQLAHADATEDGQVNAADAAAILRYCVGMDSMPPGLWTPRPTKTPTPTPKPTNTPRPTATPSPTPSPSPTPEPYLVSDNGLVLYREDPNFSKMYSFYNNTSYYKSYSDVDTNSTNCKDVVGWFCMPFTGIQNKTRSDDYAPDYTWSKRASYRIEYPIMYDGDLAYYNTHNENGEESDSGSLYAYTKVPTKNLVMEGHNARGTRTRFHHLHSLQNYLKACKNRGAALPDLTFNISLFGYWEWQVFAMYETGENEPQYTYIYNRSTGCFNQVQKWIDTQLEKSEIDFGVEVSRDDRFLTLITCGDYYHSSNPDAQNKLYIFLKYVGDR